MSAWRVHITLTPPWRPPAEMGLPLTFSRLAPFESRNKTRTEPCDGSSYRSVNGIRAVGFPLCFLHKKAVGGGLDGCFQPVEELGLRQAGRNRVEKFDNDRPRPANQTAPWPEEPGIEGNGQAWHPEALIEKRDAGLIVGRRPRRPARPFRENDDLPPIGDSLPRLLQHAAQGCRSLVAVDGDHLKFAREPAVEGDE